MTNFEKYKNELKKLGSDIAIKYNKPTTCWDIRNCTECEINLGRGNCNIARMEWAAQEYQEYKKPIKLTPQQHAFCKVFPDKWLVRSYSGQLYLFEDKPELKDGSWTKLNLPHTEKLPYVVMRIPQCFIDFPFIIYGESEVYNTSVMATWEIEE